MGRAESERLPLGDYCAVETGGFEDKKIADYTYTAARIFSLPVRPPAATTLRQLRKKNGCHFHTASEVEMDRVIKDLSETYDSTR